MSKYTYIYIHTYVCIVSVNMYICMSVRSVHYSLYSVQGVAALISFSTVDDARHAIKKIAINCNGAAPN